MCGQWFVASIIGLLFQSLVCCFNHWFAVSIIGLLLHELVCCFNHWSWAEVVLSSDNSPISAICESHWVEPIGLVSLLENVCHIGKHAQRWLHAIAVIELEVARLRSENIEADPEHAYLIVSRSGTITKAEIGRNS
jgi:hypothetical protein